ncbi:hypothetical protein THAOC_19635, partial [Thalassiosira oceanica]
MPSNKKARARRSKQKKIATKKEALKTSYWMSLASPRVVPSIPTIKCNHLGRSVPLSTAVVAFINSIFADDLNDVMPDFCRKSYNSFKEVWEGDDLKEIVMNRCTRKRGGICPKWGNVLDATPRSSDINSSSARGANLGATAAGSARRLTIPITCPSAKSTDAGSPIEQAEDESDYQVNKLAVQQYSPANPPLGVPNLLPLLVERECSAVKIKQHGKRRAIRVASFPLAVVCYRLPKAASSLRSALSVLGISFPASPEYTHPTRSRPRGPRPWPPPSPKRAPAESAKDTCPGGARIGAWRPRTAFRSTRPRASTGACRWDRTQRGGVGARPDPRRDSRPMFSRFGRTRTGA